MKRTQKLLLPLLLWGSMTAAYAGIFSDHLGGAAGAGGASQANASAIFRRHIGAANPVRWSRQLPGPANADSFLSSASWRATRSDFLRTYGRNVQVNRYLDYQEYLFRRAIRINNKASFRSLDVKGNLAESLMDDFYRKDGWEILDGKRGRNGFDGLYVRRSKSGRITDWIAADAKSGSSKLAMTNRGRQLSPEWVEGNLKDLLAAAEEEYRNNPSAVTKQRIADLKQIMRTSGRRPRVFTMRLEHNGGKIQYRLENIGVDGNPVGKPMFVDMNVKNTGTMLKMERAIYKHLEKHISVYNPQGAAKLVGKIQQALKKGTIKSDSDLYRFIKREIPDKKLAAAVAQELGEKPPRGSLARAIGEKLCRRSDVLWSAAIVAGFVIARDAMRGGITSDTFREAAIIAGATLAAGVAVDYAAGFVVKQASKYIAKLTLEATGKKISERVLSEMVGKTLGGSLQIAFALYFIGDTIYNYDKGNMTQTDMLVNVGIVFFTTAATVFLTCTQVGTALGGPAGTAIGVVIGAIGGLASGGYSWYVEGQRQKRLLLEARHLADWETRNNRERLQETISKLQTDSERMRNEAWRELFSAD